MAKQSELRAVREFLGGDIGHRWYVQILIKFPGEQPKWCDLGFFRNKHKCGAASPDEALRLAREGI